MTHWTARDLSHYSEVLDWITSVKMAANGDVRQRRANGMPSKAMNGVINESKRPAGMAPDEAKSSTSWVTLVVCVSGIYAAL